MNTTSQIEQINRVESTLRGLEYVETLRDGSFKAWNWHMEAMCLTHIDGIRHERSVNRYNLKSKTYLALKECPRMAKINQLV